MYKRNTLKANALRLIGGGKSLIISALRHSSISYFVLILVSFLYVACSKDTSVSHYPEMQAYYAESCNLGVATTDSVQHFTQKVNTFVTQHTDASADPLYPKIVGNIQSACFRLNITIDDEWLPDYEDTF